MGHLSVKQHIPAQKSEMLKFKLLAVPLQHRGALPQLHAHIGQSERSLPLARSPSFSQVLRPSLSTVSLHWNMWHITKTSPSLCGMVFYLWAPKGH